MPKPLVIKTKTGQVAGYGVGVEFRKVVQYSRHHLNVPAGWAIDAAVFADLPRYGFKRICLLDTERHVLWECALTTFQENKVPVVIERGFGEQVALCDGFWRRTPARTFRGEQAIFAGRG